MKSLKRLFCFLALILFTFIIFSPQALASQEKIYDQAHLFDAKEMAELKAEIETFETSSQMEAIVVTVQQHDKISAQVYADDFFDQHGFGFGPRKDGILFLIDLQKRTYYISTHGSSIQLFTDARIDSILKKAKGMMKNGDYGQAALTILKEATKYSQNYKYDEATQSFKKVNRLEWYEILIAAILALGAAIATYASVYGNYNLKRSRYSYAYRDQGSLKLTKNNDLLTNTTMTSRYIPPRSNNGGGGGSSTHTSSGGSTHGGGGSSF